MAIKNSFSMRKNLKTFFSLAGALLLLAACETGIKRADRSGSQTVVPAATPPPPPPVKEFGTENEIPPVQAPALEVPQSRQTREKPKLAVILGPGGVRAYAHAGVIEELHRMRVPLVAIGGLEMGALPAALYASKPQGFEAEWQMMKLKEDDFIKRGLISGEKPKDLQDWKDYLNTVFGSARIEDARVTYGCMTVSLEKQSTLIMNRGSFAQALPYCLAFPPFFRPYDKHIAGANQLASMVRYFRQKGATHILYVDVLSDKSRPPIAASNETNAVIWSLTSTALDQQNSQVQDVLRVPISNEITAFSHRREMIQKGKEAASKALPSILQKMGFDL